MQKSKGNLSIFIFPLGATYKPEYYQDNNPRRPYPDTEEHKLDQATETALKRLPLPLSHALVVLGVVRVEVGVIVADLQVQGAVFHLVSQIFQAADSAVDFFF